MIKSAAIMGGLIGLALASPAAADRAILVLDASGSMWGQIEGVPKIQIAEGMVGDLLNDWSADVELGVIAYGHREKANCADIETLVPVGPVDAGVINAAVGGLDPKGKTPITEALRQAAAELRSTEEKATVILVSDGLETCEADPCAAAAEMEAAGIDFTVHVVGFGTSADENRQLQCIADNTGGQFLEAADAPELHQAMAVVKQDVAQNLEPRVIPAAASAGSAIFVDSFDGEAPDKHWDVRNEDLDAHIVENGTLLLIATQYLGMESDELANVFSLLDADIEGDWDMSVDFYPDFATLSDRLQLGLLDDDGTPIRAGLYTYDRHGDGSCAQLNVSISRQGSQEASHVVRIVGTDRCGYGELSKEQFIKVVDSLEEQGGTLTLRKRGRGYSASFTSSAFNEVFTTDDVTLIRPSGRPALSASQTRDVPGETSVLIEEFRISKVN